MRPYATALVATTILLVSCSESKNSEVRPTDGAVEPSKSYGALDTGKPWELVYHDADNTLYLRPDSVGNEQFLYNVAVDSNALLLLADNRTGTLQLDSGAVSLSMSSENDGTASTNLAPGSWDIVYKPTVFNKFNPPVLILRFESSPYYLHIDQSQQQITEDGKYVKIESYFTQTMPTTNLAGSHSEQAIVPMSARFYLRYKVEGGKESSVSMNDDGKSEYGDATAADGVYSAIVKITDAGAYEFVIEADAIIANTALQRTFLTNDNLSDERVRLVSKSVNATPNLVFDQTISEGQYGIPLLVKFNDESIPDVVRVAGEVWATDNIGEQIRIVDNVSGVIHPEPQGNDAHGLALIIQSSDLPNVGRFVSVSFRITEISLLDTGVDILVGDREVLVTGLPD